MSCCIHSFLFLPLILVYGILFCLKITGLNAVQIQKPILEKKSNIDLAHLWNKAVDKTFGTVIASLSSRGW